MLLRARASLLHDMLRYAADVYQDHIVQRALPRAMMF